MPRWGDLHLVESLCKTYDDVVPVIRNFLKALVFLHHHRIIHRDIQPRNTLVNHFTYAPLQRVLARSVRLKHRRQLQCVIMDFNISIIAPPSADLRSYRLPYTTSFAGAYLQPPDVHQGEFEYNPFAFDVAAMGILLCHYFQHMSQKVPILAPLLDWMTTRDISHRCTAEEALAFFERLVAEHPVSHERILSEHYDRIGEGHETCNRWKGLPEDFVKKWSKYRKPPVPRGVLMLRWLYMRDRFFVIPRVRWFFSRAYCWTFGACFGWLQRLWG
ncbi:kinase-like domain-containing protein [Cristinia sonorae]|uniref:Kinase-like domain-containing protein n=1 Tax=Cristinia sonorae TaxID=1940300 RepID=A0A8K0UJZ5_9AGAR|nr:kinase-like domain-containing protein [Cristinia sonorae]